MCCYCILTCVSDIAIEVLSAYMYTLLLFDWLCLSEATTSLYTKTKPKTKPKPKLKTKTKGNTQL